MNYSMGIALWHHPMIFIFMNRITPQQFKGLGSIAYCQIYALHCSKEEASPLLRVNKNSQVITLWTKIRIYKYSHVFYASQSLN